MSGESNSPDELKENLKIKLEDIAALENLDISSSLPS
jgi:hypothetical protein